MTTAVGPGAANLGNAGQTQTAGLTPEQQQQLNDPNLSAADKAKLVTQMKLQNQQEAMAFISNVMKKRNDIAMSVINNLR
jgi:hypothetical protein